MIGLLGRQSSRCGHGELGIKQAEWPKDVDTVPAARKDKLVEEKRAESLTRTKAKEQFLAP